MYGIFEIFLEVSIADEFRVDAAVVGIINFFSHQAIKQWAHMGRNLIGLDGNFRWLLRHGDQWRT